MNISATPVPDRIVWDKILGDIFSSKETLQIPYVFKVSMDDVLTPGNMSDDWDITTVNSMFSELESYIVFKTEDVYLNSAN